MAQSSAKIDAATAACRQTFGPQVVLMDARFQPSDPAHLFDHTAWKHAEPIGIGRGANWFVNDEHGYFVLRHFRRGGAVARLLGDKYWFNGEDRTRSFAEFRLLKKMHDQQLPVPEPVAAGYCRNGLWYTAQLLTRRIPDTQTWSAQLIAQPAKNAHWSEVGRTVARLHKALVDHADLNVHNLLVDSSASVFIIDFDKSFERTSPDGGWREQNLARLQRSLHKILPGKGELVEQGWQSFHAAYVQELAHV